ncbi:MAG: signal peptidase I [Solirubrobacterales bacterium]
MNDQVDGAPDGYGPGDGKRKSNSESFIELVSIVAIALALALAIQAFVVKPYKIPSESMVPTLEIGQRVLVNRVEGRFGTPSRGDVVVFNPPAGAETSQCGVSDGQEYLPGLVYESGGDDLLAAKMPCPRGTPGKFSDAFIKRVVGLPGEELKVIRGHVYINGKQLDEPYINTRDSCDREGSFSSDCTYSLDITIAPDSYFMMGDNRNASADSRIWGPVPKENLIGNAFMTYWPPKRIGGL